ncbi:MAG TPA: FAD-dependent oxidoreductase, partial [Mycobacteriales bacterium]|nr:FAD-dependent oxidoreductase [Mycobacteriales bacterium]
MSIRVVVVGRGVAGAATAFALAAGGAEVVVVDTVRSGQATAAGAGIVQPWSSAAEGPFYDLYAAGAAYYPTLLARLAEAGVSDVVHVLVPGTFELPV